MAEYIEREAAYTISKRICDAIRNREYHPATFGRFILDLIDDLPAADVTPVRHGRWIPVDEMEDAFDCSECDAMVSKRLNYCPNCGAKNGW